MSTKWVIDTLEGVKDLKLNQFERASTQPPPGTQTFSISSAPEQFISVNFEAESDSRIWFYFLFINPFAGIICTEQAATLKCYISQRQHLPRERSLWWGSVRQTAMTRFQKMLLVRNISDLPNQRSGWESSSLPRISPANITGFVLQCGLTAQKTDLAGKSHVPLTSWMEKSPTKNPNKPKPQLFVLAQMHPVLL